MTSVDYSRFPPELIDKIIKTHTDDTRTLASCSLVCCSWSPIARAHRSRELSIKPRSDTPPRSLLLLCDPTSTVLPYIRHLNLTLELLPSGEDRYVRSDSPDRFYKCPPPAPWLDDVLPAMRVDDITALEHLCISEFQWDRLSTQTRRSLMSLCKRVLSLDLYATPMRWIPCTAVAELLNAATSLQHFKLICPGWLAPLVPEESLEPPIHSVAPMELSLSSFEIDSCSRPYLLGLPIFFPAPHLKKVSVRGIKEQDVQPLISFLRSCTAILEHLYLEFGLRGSQIPGWLAQPEPSFCAQGGLSGMESLRSLTTTLAAHLPDVPAILRQIESPRLTDLEIRAHVDVFISSNLGQLCRSLSTGMLASTRPRVTFVGLPSLIYCDTDAEKLQTMRRALLAELSNSPVRRVRFMHKKGLRVPVKEILEEF